MRRIAVGLAFGAVTTMVACGLSVTGNGADLIADGGNASVDGNTAETSPPDGAVEATTTDGSTATDAAPDVEAGPPPCTCSVTAPAGFDLVAYRADQTANCVGDLAQDDRLTNPTISGNACSCATCTITTAPTSCNTGDWGTTADDNSQKSDATCDMVDSKTHAINNGTCVPDNGTFPYHGRLVVPTATGAACASTAMADQTTARTTPVRVCAPVQNGQSCACDSALAAGFKACFRAAGDVACPNGTTKTSLGSGTNVTCNACGCSITSQTCAPTVDFFSDNNCGTKNATIDATDCTYIPTDVTNFGSYRSNATPSATCQAGQAPTGEVALTGVETICCP